MGEPFAYFQWNEGWQRWEQVASEYCDDPQVLAAYCKPGAIKSAIDAMDATSQEDTSHDPE